LQEVTSQVGSDGVDEKPSFSEGGEPRFQSDGIGGKVSGCSWSLNKFPHGGESVDSFNLQNRLTYGLMGKTFRGERRSEENRTRKLEVPNSKSQEWTKNE